MTLTSPYISWVLESTLNDPPKSAAPASWLQSADANHEKTVPSHARCICLKSLGPVPGSMNVHWNEGAPDCAATPQNPLQVHAYELQTFILRQSPCVHFEANFIYLLVGSDKALLIDTGAVPDPEQMPLATTVLELLPDSDIGTCCMGAGMATAATSTKCRCIP